MPRSRPSYGVYGAVVAFIVVVDYITKAIAVTELVPQHVVRQVLGDVVQFRLVYNPGAAFGLYLGPFSRWIFLILTLGALVVLWQLLRATRAGDWTRTMALALVTGGAIGNLVDRIRSPRGVVDFIDVGIGTMRWPTFNVADMAVSVGAFLLAWVLWGEDQRQVPASSAAADSKADSSAAASG